MTQTREKIERTIKTIERGFNNTDGEILRCDFDYLVETIRQLLKETEPKDKMNNEAIDQEIKDLKECLNMGYCSDMEVIAGLEKIIRQLLKEREWQPIETAPKDGTWFLIWRWDAKKRWPKSPEKWVHKAQWDSYSGKFMSEHGFENPTHWQPLPQPPKGDE